MHLGDLLFEQFIVLFLSRSHQIIKSQIISEGGVTGTVVDPRKIFKFALECNAVSIILGHNHPSGSPKPSSNDLDLTKKIKHAGQILDIQVVDHIIIGTENYYSFADEGTI
jgi:DNA repair protein RadC